MCWCVCGSYGLHVVVCAQKEMWVDGRVKMCGAPYCSAYAERERVGGGVGC